MEIIFKLNSVSEVYELREWLNSLGSKIEIPNVNIKDDISELGLTLRTENCLRAENITKISKLVTWSHICLLKTPNLGKKSIKEIEDKLHRMGLDLSSFQKAAREISLEPKS